jgi:hypothetical protein
MHVVQAASHATVYHAPLETSLFFLSRGLGLEQKHTLHICPELVLKQPIFFKTG